MRRFNLAGPILGFVSVIMDSLLVRYIVICLSRHNLSLWQHLSIRARSIKWMSKTELVKIAFVIIILYLIISGYIRPMISSTSQVLSFREDRFLKYSLQEEYRKGPGENSGNVKLTKSETQRAGALFNAEGFNIVISDKIALDRAIPDPRHSMCKFKSYPSELSMASVIIVYYNEAWSAVLRTVHSVVNRTPPSYLQEVILVDDASTRGELGESFHRYVEDTWPDGVVRMVRSPERSGLIRARLLGAQVALGEVLVFLDAHCETARGWLEPLLSRIKENRNRVVCPIIDQISAASLEYQGFPEVTKVGGFWWDMNFLWQDAKKTADKTEPVKSPTMAGGIFAINRNFFYEIGSYDAGMQIWGAENLEMSFRIWMCGGSLEIVPCAHVGHIFRNSHPYGFPGDRDYHALNSVRLVEVWLDEYSRLFYSRRPLLSKPQYQSDVSDRVALRKRLQCKSFRWYLQNVYPHKFVPDENVIAWGNIRNPSSNLCFDTMMASERMPFTLKVFFCNAGGFQIFSHSKLWEIRREESCADFSPSHQHVRLNPCTGNLDRQAWRYNLDTGEIRHVVSDLCMDVTGVSSGQPVKMSRCAGEDGMKWEMENYRGL